MVLFLSLTLRDTVQWHLDTVNTGETDMHTHFVRADAIYHEIISTPDMETKRQIYLDKIVQPWKPMMNMVAGLFSNINAHPSDSFYSR